MTEQEIKALTEVELTDLKSAIFKEIDRRESLANIPQNVIRAAEHYRSLGGDTSELVTVINSLPEDEIEQ